jgi:AraC-like DNA-binding protein
MPSFIRTTSLQGLEPLIDELGGNVNEILIACDIQVDLSQLEHQYMPYRQYAYLLEYCAGQFNCYDFGIRLANLQSIDILGPIALVAKTGTTLGEALQWVLKYLHVHCPALSLKINPVENSEQLLLSFEILLDPLPKTSQVTELTIALGVNIIRQLSSHQCQPLNIYLPERIDGNKHVYARQFGCEVIGFRNIAGVVLASRDLSVAIDNHQLSQVEPSLAFLQQQGEVEMVLTDKIIALIKPLLCIGQSSNGNVSHALGLHPRQLHRLLADQNTSFVKIKDGVRQSLARYYLCESQLSFGYISELLGYQEQATFSVACRRWFNQSGRQFRSQNQKESSQ